MKKKTEALQAKNIHKSYGLVKANDGIDLQIFPGTIHALVGENGAGKSTLMRIFQGIEKPDLGEVFVDNEAVNFTNPKQALKMGIGMVHQEFMMAPDLSLLENLILGEEPLQNNLGVFSRVNWTQARAEGDELARNIGVSIDWDRKANSTPVHILQFVEIIRLLRRGCRIIILDEPTAVLAPPQVEELFNLLRKLSKSGTTIIFISHKINEVVAIADYVSVMRRGKISFSNTIDNTSISEIAFHIVGDNEKNAKNLKGSDKNIGDILLEINDLSSNTIDKSQELSAISLKLHSGQIVGVAGVSGNGQIELLECVIGLRGASAGSINLKDQNITQLGVFDRRRLGISYVSSDRANEGLSLSSSIEDNIIAGSHRNSPISNGHTLNKRIMRKTAVERLDRLSVKYGNLIETASSLSGGNQQKLVFAREISNDPSVLVISQPTRGVDLNGIKAIHDIIIDFASNGGAVLITSEELEELQKLSDEIIVISNGKLVGRVDGQNSDIKEIGRMMVVQGGGNA